MPLSLPSLATITLFIIVNNWNAWFDGMIYMSSPKNYPLQTYLQTMISSSSMQIMTRARAELLKKISDRTVKSAQIFIAALPMLILYTAQNTLDIVRGMGEARLKVVKGAEKPLARDLHCAVSHGETGLGDVVIPHVQSDFYEKSVEDAIYESAEQAGGELVYLGVGPQTNLALALKKYPRLSGKIRRIVLMGGSLTGGNMTQASEFNAYVDPESLHAVFHAGVPITMVGLDVTLQTKLPGWVLERLQSMENPHAKLAARIMDFIRRRSRQYGLDEANLHDALAFCAVVCPDILQTKPYYVDVETKGELTRGMTVADFRNVCPEKSPNADCAVEADIDRFWNWLVAVFDKEEQRFREKSSQKA